MEGSNMQVAKESLLGDFKNLQANNHSYFFATSVADRIIKAIDEGVISFSELKITNKDDINKLVLKIQERDARQNVEELREVKSGHFFARLTAKKVRKAVEDGATSWKKLETNPYMVNKYVLKAQERDARQGIKGLRKVKSNYFFAKLTAKKIRKAVTEGATSWSKLATSENELDELVLKAQEKEK